MSGNRAVRGLLCAFVAVFAGGASASADTGRLPRAPEFQQRVDGAVDRGVAWLRKQQAQDGAFADFPSFDAAVTALAYHTMRVCGVKADDPAARSAWTAMRRDATPETLQTYSAALFLMAAQEKGVPDRKGTDGRVKLDAADLKWVREIAGRLARGQTEEGSWSYDVGPPDYVDERKKKRKDDEDDRNGAPLPAGFRSSGDFSNTQYALLGLKAAARCGAQVNAAIWKRSLTLMLDAQEKTGPEVERGTGPVSADRGATFSRMTDHARGWGYTSREGSGSFAYASMTAGGVSSVVLCRSELLEQRALDPALARRSEQAAWDGLAWLGTRWTPPRRDAARQMPAAPVNYYEYYGVERAGVLAGVAWMATLDWYGAGAEPLLAAQDAAGAWSGPSFGLMTGTLEARAKAQKVVDTCFALLFLKRGTTPVRLGAVTRSEGASDIDFAAAAKLSGQDLEDFLDLVLARWARATEEPVRTRLFDGATSVGPRIVTPLLVRMSDESAAERASSHALLRHATGLDHGYDPDAPRVEREMAVERWQGWWLGAEATLRYDAISKKLAH